MSISVHFRVLQSPHNPKMYKISSCTNFRIKFIKYAEVMICAVQVNLRGFDEIGDTGTQFPGSSI